MMDVYWLEQTAEDVPADNGWLSDAEMILRSTLRFPKRRDDWQLGRWTAKRALAAYLNRTESPHALAELEIPASPSGAPQAFLANQRLPVSISLSHRGRSAVCALSPSGAALGCDLEISEPRSAGFVADYFTAEERAIVNRIAEEDRPPLLALLWSAKESALKALGEGLRLDTRTVRVLPALPLRRGQGTGARFVVATTPADSHYWYPLHVRCDSEEVFHGWWSREGDWFRTLVANPPPCRPVMFKPSFILSETASAIPEAGLGSKRSSATPPLVASRH